MNVHVLIDRYVEAHGQPEAKVLRQFDDFTRLHTCDACLDFVKYRQNLFHPVANIHDHNCADTDLCQILLKAKALVCGEDDSEAAIDSRTKQNAIPKTLELFTPHDGAVKLWQERLDLLWNGLVNEQPQRPLPPLVRSPGRQ